MRLRLRKEGDSSPAGDQDRIRELRLATRTLGFLAALTGVLYLRVMVPEKLGDSRIGDLSLESSLMLAFLLTGIAGLVMAWRWEAAGGAVALLSGAGLAVLDYSAYEGSRWFAAFLYSSPFIVAGLLCLFCSFRRRIARQPSGRDEEPTAAGE